MRIGPMKPYRYLSQESVVRFADRSIRRMGNSLRDLDFPRTLTRIGVGKPLGTKSFPGDLIPEHFGEMRKRNPKEKFLKTKTEAQTFLYFLARELLRHLKDVEAIEIDMADLCNEWKLHPPNVTNLTWISTKRLPK
jgi:hypothetical protein